MVNFTTNQIIDNLIFWMLFLEVIAFLIIICPMPKGYKKKLLNFLSTNKFMGQLTNFQLAFVIFVSIFFYQSYQTQKILNEEHKQEKQFHFQIRTERDQEILSQKFQAQKQLYLCGCALFATYALFRHISLLRNYYSKQTELDELKSLIHKNEDASKKDNKIKDNNNIINDEQMQQQNSNISQSSSKGAQSDSQANLSNKKND